MTNEGRMCGGLDRREFLAALASATAGLAVAGPLSATRWGAGRGRSALEPVGLQLYTVRSLMAQDVEGTLRRVADIGYREVEFAGYFDRSPARLREILDGAGLAAPSAHVDLDSLDEDRAPETLEAARTVGHDWLVIGWVPPEQRSTLDDYRRLADRLEAAGSRVNEAGLRFAYHNHEFEFEPIDGTVPYEILAGTDPGLVALQLDLYWVRRGGSDALDWFRRHPGRFPSVHVKDMAEDGAMVDVGAGVIDWSDLLSHARSAGVRHYFVEHDQPDDPLRSVRDSFEHLNGLPT